MSILIIATAFSSGSSGWPAQYAEPSSPSSSPAKFKNRMPRFCFGCLAIPARQFDHPGGARKHCRPRPDERFRSCFGASGILPAEPEVIVVRADDDVLVGLARAGRRRRCGPSSPAARRPPAIDAEKPAGKANDSGFEILVDALPSISVEVSCRRAANQRSARSALHLDEWNPGVRRDLRRRRTSPACPPRRVVGRHR